MVPSPLQPSGSFGNAKRPLNGALLSLSTLRLVSLSPIGGALFALIYLLEGFTRPGYHAWQDSISALSLGPGGWLQQVNFILFGVFTLCSAVGWRQALAPGVGAIAYPFLRGVEGIGLIIDGIFSQDPEGGYPPGASVTTVSGHAIIHVLFAFVTITTVALSTFVLAWRFKREPLWRGWMLYAITTGLLTIICIALFGALSKHVGSPAGFFERLSTAVSTVFGFLVLLRLLHDRQQKTTKAEGHP